MWRQRNMGQMKEQIKSPEKELNAMETSNLLDAELKTLVIRMLKELSEDLSSIKEIQSEMKDTLIEIKNNLQGNNNRLDEAENQINDLEHRNATRRKTQKSGESISSFRTTSRCPHDRCARRRRIERARNWKSV